MDILSKVKQYQEEHKLTNRAMAKKMGIKEALYSYTVNGKRKPKDTFRGGVIRAFPFFADDVVDEWKQRVTIVKQNQATGGQQGDDS